MNQEKIGKFIYELRKNNGLTQKEFADKLSVTAQAVSKWENGRGIPDIELIKEISKIFNVEIESILAGENIKKQKNNKLKIILLIVGILFVISLIIVYFLSSNKFIFSSLESSSNDWKVKGVAAYSKDKKSIYISDIEYLNKNNIKDKYNVVECILYENNNEIDKKISQCGKIDKSKDYDSNNAKELSELLKDIEFNIDNYKSSCRNLKNSSLYIDINVLTTNNKIITYKVPLKLDSNCSE
ncbi:MAG: helix-turn-helix transcriptional regulator [Firmicutes bacterium]|nr:helix-turn-helix transcriptional regulator [Bacillota bacterium]